MGIDYSNPCKPSLFLSLSHTHTQLKPNEFEVIAMYNYKPKEALDLPLVKGSKVIICDSSRQHLWLARNEMG